MFKSVLEEDLDSILNCPYINWKNFEKTTFLLTGVTGLVGSLLLRTLLYVNEKRNLRIRILGLVRDPGKAKRLFGPVQEEGRLVFLTGDVRQEIKINERVDYIIHGAAVTDSKQMVRDPVNTFLTSVDGTRHILDYADRVKVKGMVYISSMEVYGITGEKDNPVTEDRLGYLDLTNLRSSYQEGKRAAEFLCTAYNSQKKVPVKTARLAQTFGPGVFESDQRVFSQFAHSVIDHKDIVLHTRGQSMGNYCYTADMIKGLFCILERGQAGRAYNVVNEANTMTIKDMAELVAARLSDGRIKVIYDIPESVLLYGYAPDTKMRLSGSRLRALGWSPQVGLTDMYRRMISFWGYKL